MNLEHLKALIPTLKKSENIKIIIEEKFGGKIYVHNSDDWAVFTIELPIITINH